MKEKRRFRLDFYWADAIFKDWIYSSYELRAETGSG